MLVGTDFSQRFCYNDAEIIPNPPLELFHDVVWTSFIKTKVVPAKAGAEVQREFGKQNRAIRKTTRPNRFFLWRREALSESLSFGLSKTSRIKTPFLPPYSPNLNLIGRLWRFMRAKDLNNKYDETFSMFRAAYENFFGNIKRFSKELDSLSAENFQILGQAL